MTARQSGQDGRGGTAMDQQGLLGGAGLSGLSGVVVAGAALSVLWAGVVQGAGGAEEQAESCYGTFWGRGVEFWWMVGLSGAVGAIGLLVLVAVMWLRRGRKSGFELVLEEMAECESAKEALGVLAESPTMVATSAAGRGWNRLVAGADEIYRVWEASRAEKGLEKLRQGHDSLRLAGLLDALPDGVVLVDGGGMILRANRACEGKVGRPLEGFVGKSVWELFPEPAARQRLQDVLEKGFAGNEVCFDVEVGAAKVEAAEEGAAEPGGAETEPTGDGQELPERTVLRVFCRRFSEARENNDIVLIIRDITQQVLSQASRDDFIAHVSHEFRSPLTNIRAYAETLLSDMVLDAAAQKEAFNVINEETARLTRLVNEVLDLSRLESGSMVLDKGEVVLDRLVRQCTSDVSAWASSKQITLQTNYHPKLPNLYADREKLAVVINNLLTNAIKYTPEGGTVFVETNCDERFVYIKVTDTGYGIAAENQEKIFEKFYRVDRTETADIPGSGLGLATAKEIVNLHGGTIMLVSELNKGTEITVKLPLAEAGPVLGPAAERGNEGT